MPGGLGLGLEGAGGAGAASQFMNLLYERKVKEQEMLQQVRQQEAAEQYRQQMVELDRQREAESTRQFNVGEDRLKAKDIATAEKEAARQQEIQSFLSTLPPDVQNLFHAKELVDIDDPHVLEGMEAHQTHTAAEAAAAAAAKEQEYVSHKLFEEGLIRGRPQTGGGGSQESTSWIQRDGVSVLIDRNTGLPSKAWKPGDQPFNAARDALRHVTSGDVGRITDFDSAIMEAKNLEQSLDQTGTVSWVESSLPNAVTEMTGGIGAGAKTRLAQINLIKQLIGKTLEGGVLRKEDEIKYTSILPRINDTPEVAKAKIQGLQQTIARKRELFIENLTDAGFVTEDFTARPQRGISGATGATPSATPSGIKSITLIK